MTVGGPADTRELPGLSITKVAVGPMDNNAYLLRCTQTGELALIDAARAGGLGGPLDGPGAEGDAGQARAGQGAHLGQARGQRAAGPQAELPVAGREPVLAGGTVIPGPGDAHRAQDGGDRFGRLPAYTACPPQPHPARTPAYQSSCSSSTACSIAAPAVACAARIACSSTPSPRLPPTMPAARPASLPNSASAISSIRAASHFFPLPAGAAPTRP